MNSPTNHVKLKNVLNRKKSHNQAQSIKLQPKPKRRKGKSKFKSLRKKVQPRNTHPAIKGDANKPLELMDGLLFKTSGYDKYSARKRARKQHRKQSKSKNIRFLDLDCTSEINRTYNHF